jgi:hypothetical protein
MILMYPYVASQKTQIKFVELFSFDVAERLKGTVPRDFDFRFFHESATGVVDTSGKFDTSGVP